MAKKRRRKKEICPNCKVRLNPNGNFCPNCGQENHQKRASVKMLITDFTQDYWTFDSKLFRSLKPLIFNPGFLTLEFIKGKRMKYIRPIRLYLFISFIFFLVTSLLNTSDNSKSNLSFSSDTGESITTRDKNESTIPNTKNNTSIKDNKKEDSLKQVKLELNLKELEKLEKNGNYIQAFLVKKAIVLDSEEGNNKMKLAVKQNISIFLFFTIPIFAFILFVLFYKKERYYVDHLIFALHTQSFIFLYLIFSTLFEKIIIDYPKWITFLIMAVYLILAAKKTYNTTYIGSFFRLLGVFFIHAIISIILFVLYLATVFITIV